MPDKIEKPAQARSLSALADELGVSRPTLNEWRDKPGAPTDRNVAAWEAFIAANGLGLSGNKTSKKREYWLTVRAEHDARIAAVKAAQAERSSVSRADVDALLLHVATMQKTVLFPALEREFPPKCEGRTAAEISLLGRELADRLCGIFTSAIESWGKEVA